MLFKAREHDLFGDRSTVRRDCLLHRRDACAAVDRALDLVGDLSEHSATHVVGVEVEKISTLHAEAGQLALALRADPPDLETVAAREVLEAFP